MNPTQFSTQFLPAMEDLLRVARISFTREQSAIVTSHPSTGAVVKIVSADNILREGRTVEEVEEAAYWMLDALFTEKSEITPYMFIAGDVEFFNYSTQPQQRDKLEQDTFGPAKWVGTLDEVIEQLTPLFQPKSDVSLAKTSASVVILKHLQYGQPKLSSASHVFEPADILNKFSSETSGGLSSSQLEKASRIYRNVMGSTYQLVWTSDGPCIRRLGFSNLLPVTLTSLGEKMAAAFSVYLAELEELASSEMCLGLYEALSRLSSAKALNAYLCLGEFLIATGSSAIIQAENDSGRRTAKAGLYPFVKKGRLSITEKRMEAV